MNNNTFSLEIIDGHPLIKTDIYTILIDTGSPITIHNSRSFNFLSVNFDVQSNYLTILELVDLIGINITTLLGMDIISKYKPLFDYKNKIITFNNQEDNSFTGNSVDINSFMKIPTVELKINNKLLKFFLDSGAKHSYLLNNITQNYTSAGIIDDFYPGIGSFTTDSFKINTYFDNNSFLVTYGILPKELELLLNMADITGIIGSDFFYNFKTEIDMKKNKLNYVSNSCYAKIKSHS